MSSSPPDKERIGREMEEFFEGLWQKGDFWNFESSDYERARFAHEIRLLAGRRYGRALELGCGAGAFTSLVAKLADRVVASDVAPAAIERAKQAGLANVEFRVENAMDRKWRDEGPWDLIVFNDTMCYLGWRYTFFDVAWFAHELYEATAPDGHVFMANTMNEEGDYLLLPFVVRTYRDLLLNVGFRIAKEDTFRGTRDGVEFTVLETLYGK